MVERVASLPMYALPEVAGANRALWAGVAVRLRAAGLGAVPATLSEERPAVPEAIGPDVLFTQTCGYPLLTRYRGQARVLGLPRYAAPGCAGASYRALFVTRAEEAGALADMRGRVFGVNSPHSNSGMNLPRLSLARLAAGRPFFSRVVVTGGHVRSLEMIADGRIDVAAIDCVTHALVARYRPALAARTRVLEETVASPSLPLVTSAATPPDIVARLRDALGQAVADPSLAAAREALLLTGIEDGEAEDYAVVLDVEAEARRLGYAEIR